MSFVSIIVTKKIIDCENDDVHLSTINHLKENPLLLADGEYGYLIEGFAPLWFPHLKPKYCGGIDKLCCNKRLFINTLKKINEKYLIIKVLFIILGNNEKIKCIKKIRMPELITAIIEDKLEKDVLYKIIHDFNEY